MYSWASHIWLNNRIFEPEKIKEDGQNMEKKELKSYLIGRLKEANAFWSYDQSKIEDVPDDILIELVMLHLDLDDIDKLFQLYPYRVVKEAWIKNVVAQGERYYVLNKFFAWYYFKVRNPRVYVKSMATRQWNKIMNQGGQVA